MEFFIISEHDPSLALDIEGGSVDENARLIVWKFTGNANQRFSIDSQGIITSVNSRLALDVAGGAACGNGIIQYSIHGGDNQRWVIHPDGTIRLAIGGLALDISGGSTEPGTPVIAWDIHGNTNQRWRVIPVAGVGAYIIHSVHNPELALDIMGGSADPDAQLTVWEVHGGHNQRFHLDADGFLVPQHSGLALDVCGGVGQGNHIQQYPPHGGPNQRWRALPDGTIRLLDSDHALDISGGSKEHGAKLIIWEPHGGSNQQWRFVPVPDHTVVSRKQPQQEQAPPQQHEQAPPQQHEQAPLQQAPQIEIRELTETAMTHPVVQPTVVVPADDEITQSAQALRKAMKGMGTDEATVITIIGKSTTAEIAAIRHKFHDIFQRDLIKDLKEELSGKLESVIVALVLDRAQYDANLLRKAIKGAGTDEDLLTEILCTRYPWEIAAACAAYKNLFGRDLLADVEDDTSGDIQKLYNLLITSSREGSGNIDEDVEALYKAGEGKFGTNEGVFIRIMGGNSRSYVEQLYFAYAQKYGKALDEVVKSEFSGHISKALRALCTPLDIFFANKLHKAMGGAGTDDEALVRLICTQKERALRAAAKRYLRDHKKSLKAAVIDETSGDYKKILVAVIDNFGVPE